jgi:hypothetical protein
LLWEALAKDILGDNIAAELGAFTEMEVVNREAASVYVPNLIRKALEQHRGYKVQVISANAIICHYSLELHVAPSYVYPKRRFG